MPYQKPISPPETSCPDVVDCVLANPDPAQLALLVAAASTLLLFLTFAITHIAGARSLLGEERTRITDETEAFAAFASRVAEIDVAAAPVTDGGPVVRTTFDGPQADDGIDAVREAYRDTVMAVPHYEAEYDESLATNMQLEFGEDVANAVDRGETLTPQLKGTLVERSRTARRQRTALLRQLRGESEALDEAETTLRHCHRSADRIEEAALEDASFDDLTAEWRLLEDRRQAAESLLQERQETIKTRSQERDAGGPSFEEYLYEELDVTHPVLAEATSLVERIQQSRNRVERALASRT